MCLNKIIYFILSSVGGEWDLGVGVKSVLILPLSTYYVLSYRNIVIQCCNNSVEELDM